MRVLLLLAAILLAGLGGAAAVAQSGPTPTAIPGGPCVTDTPTPADTPTGTATPPAPTDTPTPAPSAAATATAPCALLAPSGGDDLPALRAWARAAAAAPGRCGRLGPGTFQIRTVDEAGLTLDAPGVDLGGAGAGVTRIRYADNLTFGTNGYYTYGLNITADGVTVHDLAIQLGPGAGGSGIWVAIGLNGGLRDTLTRLDISGAWGPLGTAGGAAITTYQPWTVAGGHSDATITDNVIHDNPSACGLIINSDGNLIAHNVIVNTGSNGHQHAIYEQGGANRILGNTLGPNPGAGYNWHAHHTVAHLYAGGTVFADNLSLDPGFAHAVVNAILEDGTNPELPAGSWNAPSVIITGNTFRNTPGHAAAGLLLYEGVHAVVQGNVFEDTTTAITSRETSDIQGNQILQIADTGAQRAGISSIGDGTTVEGNVIRLPFGTDQTGIALGGTGARAIGNTVVFSNGVGLRLGGTDALVQGNTVVGTHGSRALTLDGTGARVLDNRLTADWLTALVQGPVVADVRGNTWDGVWRVDGAWDSLRFAGNTGAVSWTGYSALALTPASGTLLAVPIAGNVAAGALVAWDAGGIVPTAPGAATWVGVAVGAVYGPSTGYIAGAPGAILTGVCVDNAPGVGTVGVASPTQAGCLHDTGSTVPPSSGSWARFLAAGQVEIHP